MKKAITLLYFLLLTFVSQGQSKKLLSTCSTNDLMREPFSAWYIPGVKDYQPNAEVMIQLQKLNLRKITFKVFFGSWCGDSKRELPCMSKIFNQLSILEKNIQWIALDDSSVFYKQSPQHEERDMTIFRVPTFVVYEKGVEIGRINEFPVETLERDLLKIVTRQPYNPSYKSFAMIKSWLENGILSDKNISARGLADQLVGKVVREGELNACGYVLLAQNKMQEAIAVFRINANLFPNSANCFDSLGEAYAISGQKEKSIQAYEQALVLDPKNENVKTQLMKLKRG